MKDLRLLSGKKAVVIIAHPDDETIWMGGTIINNPQVDWTIYSVCRQSDSDREPKFRRVSQVLQAKAIISDLDDEDLLSVDRATKEAEKLITEKFKNKSIDFIFTHGLNGEYGHERHIAVHQAVDSLIRQKIIKPETVFYFAYKKNKDNKKPLILTGDDANVMIELTQSIFQKKRRIVAEMYGYPYGGIDVGYCTNPECFKELKINN